MYATYRGRDPAHALQAFLQCHMVLCIRVERFAYTKLRHWVNQIGDAEYHGMIADDHNDAIGQSDRLHNLNDMCEMYITSAFELFPTMYRYFRMRTCNNEHDTNLIPVQWSCPRKTDHNENIVFYMCFSDMALFVCLKRFQLGGINFTINLNWKLVQRTFVYSLYTQCMYYVHAMPVLLVTQIIFTENI